MPDPAPDIAFEAAPDQASADDTASPTTPPVSLRSIAGSLILSLGVLGIIGYFTFEPDTFRRLLHLNPWLLSAAVLTVALRVLFGMWRLHYVSQGRLGWLGALRGQLAWDFFSNVTPSTIGGGPIAAAYIARDNGLPLGEATSIMLFSMLLDQILFALAIPLLLALGTFMEIIPTSLGAIGSWTFTLYFLGFMAWVCLFGYTTLVRPLLLERLVERICSIRGLRRFRSRALQVMEQLQNRASILRTQRPWFYAKGLLLTCMVWINRYLLVVFVIWSVHPALDTVLIFLRTMALTVCSVVLPTPGGAGGIEGLYALMMGPLMPEGLVAPTLLIWRLLGYYLFIALGAYLSVYQVQKTIRRTRDRHTLRPHNGTTNGSSVVHTSEPVEQAER